MLIGMTAYVILNGIPSVTIKSDDDKLTVSGPDNTQCSMLYKDIVSIDFIEEADYTAFHGGSRKDRYMFESWECQSLGVCQLFIDTRISSCVVVTSHNQTILLNYEDNTTTKSFYQALTDFWQKHRS